MRKLYCRFWHHFINNYGYFRRENHWVCSICYTPFIELGVKIEKGAIK